MTNPLTRRLALFRIASASAVATTVAVPAVLTAVQPKNAENPVLIRLGQHLTKLDAICQQRVKAKATARAACDAAWPALPEALLVTRYSKDLAGNEREADCAGEEVWPENRHPRRYHTAHHLKRAIEDWADPDLDELDDDGREAYGYLSRLLPIAERYEQVAGDALEQSGFLMASSAHFLAAYAIERIVGRIAKIPAQTPDGITIKARAYEAWMRSGHERAKQFAAIIVGPGLAADICRVLAEGDEV